jgi:sensor histidine kinase YesM
VDVPDAAPLNEASRYSGPMASSSGPGVDDTAARLIVTPLVGMAVPNLAGMLNHSAHSAAGLIATYAWFIGIAFVTWEANLRLYLLFQDRTAWLTRPWHRVRLLIGLICLFTIPFNLSALWLWAELFQDPNATWRSIAMAVITIVAGVTFITHIYETLFLVKEWENEFQRGQHLQRLNVEAELLALKSEVSPHTLFNNLNALSHLVDQGHPRAGAFVGALAESYRYLLKTGAMRLVPLSDELALLDQFLSLATIRFAEGLKVDVHVAAHAAARWQIPPVVLPELLENAVKHNEFTTDTPLEIEIRLEGDRLTIAHAIRPRAKVSSTGVGLENLAQRFRLTTGVAARWAETGGRFVVTLPLMATDGSKIAQ